MSLADSHCGEGSLAPLAVTVGTVTILIYCCYDLLDAWIPTASVLDPLVARVGAISAIFFHPAIYVCIDKVAPASTISPVPLM